MGDYADYNVQVDSTGETVAGLCHARGSNAKLPPQWLIYVQVEDVAKSARECTERGTGALESLLERCIEHVHDVHTGKLQRARARDRACQLRNRCVGLHRWLPRTFSELREAY